MPRLYYRCNRGDPARDIQNLLQRGWFSNVNNGGEDIWTEIWSSYKSNAGSKLDPKCVCKNVDDTERRRGHSCDLVKRSAACHFLLNRR